MRDPSEEDTLQYVPFTMTLAVQEKTLLSLILGSILNSTEFEISALSSNIVYG